VPKVVKFILLEFLNFFLRHAFFFICYVALNARLAVRLELGRKRKEAVVAYFRLACCCETEKD
jgi:hypothetical protein